MGKYKRIQKEERTRMRERGGERGDEDRRYSPGRRLRRAESDEPL